jgi:hypothetical protein
MSIIVQSLPENPVCDHAYSKPENKPFKINELNFQKPIYTDNCLQKRLIDGSPHIDCAGRECAPGPESLCGAAKARWYAFCNMPDIKEQISQDGGC